MRLRPIDECARALSRARHLRGIRAVRPCRHCGRKVKTRGGLAIHEKVCRANPEENTNDVRRDEDQRRDL